jgi:predicted amidophosphoribosyltransferase
VKEALGDLLRGALDLLWPRECLVCAANLGGTREPWLCDPCRADLPLFGETDALCARCSRALGPATSGGGCPDCALGAPHFEAVRAAGAYRGPLRRLVTGLKYARRTWCAWPLGELLAARLQGWGPLRDGALVVPFPTTARARRRRGFDPPALVAAEVARLLRLPLAPSLLRRTGDPPPQASLPRGERVLAPRGTVAVARPRAAAGRTVLLVDDVLTTGATAREAARVLLGAGAARVLVAVAARA